MLGAGLELSDELVEVGGCPGAEVGQGDSCSWGSMIRLISRGVANRADGSRMDFWVTRVSLKLRHLGAVEVCGPIHRAGSPPGFDSSAVPVSQSELVDAVDDAGPGSCWRRMAATRVVVNQSVTSMMSSPLRPGGM